jgi:DNA-binding XRE family transcriptional regulator
MATQRAKQLFAQWCRGFRAHQEQTQVQFAAVLGVNRTTIVRYEGAQIFPDRDIRIRLNDMAREAGFRPIPPPR